MQKLFSFSIVILFFLIHANCARDLQPADTTTNTGTQSNSSTPTPSPAPQPTPTPTPNPTPTPPPSPAPAPTPVSVNCSNFSALPVGGLETGCKWIAPGSYSFTIPNGVTNITVTSVGAGGGAGARDYSAWSNFGGGGGGAATRSFAVTPGTVATLFVGTGGAGHLSNWNPATAGDGTDSTFTILGTAVVGGGGQGGDGGLQVINAPGGIGTGGATNCNGGNGNRCANAYFSCAGSPGQCGGADGPAQTVSVTSPASGSKLGGHWGGAGGGASKYGGMGNDPYNCGGGGGEYTLDITKAPGIKGSDGCVVVTW